MIARVLVLEPHGQGGPCVIHVWYHDHLVMGGTEVVQDSKSRSNALVGYERLLARYGFRRAWKEGEVSVGLQLAWVGNIPFRFPPDVGRQQGNKEEQLLVSVSVSAVGERQ